MSRAYDTHGVGLEVVGVVKARNAMDPAKVLASIVEPQRKRARISLRAAGERAGMSEGSWRQLAASGVNVGGKWVARSPRRDQVLAMAMAVNVLDEAAEALGATPDEVAATRERVVILDPAEEEIMRMRHLQPRERLALTE